jgi:hypothetical protein
LAGGYNINAFKVQYHTGKTWVDAYSYQGSVGGPLTGDISGGALSKSWRFFTSPRSEGAHPHDSWLHLAEIEITMACTGPSVPPRTVGVDTLDYYVNGQPAPENMVTHSWAR